MSVPSRVVVITDLDGTLLDHDTYSFEPARPALARLKRDNIPLVLNSSKTAAEIIELRKMLGNHDPFVVENGAGIFVPANGVFDKTCFGKDRPSILKTLKSLRNECQFQFKGFDDMSIEDVVAATGLTPKAAELARQRDFTEPLQWQDSQQRFELFCSKLHECGLTATRGGRFISISGSVDKGAALTWLREYYQRQFADRPVMVALGDSDNDRAMLELADYAVLVRSPAHEPPEIESDMLTITEETGPLGWNNSLMLIIDKITEQR